jgi:hypothetical protein
VCGVCDSEFDSGGVGRGVKKPRINEAKRRYEYKCIAFSWWLSSVAYGFVMRKHGVFKRSAE